MENKSECSLKKEDDIDDMDYGILRALHDMMALEIDLTPPPTALEVVSPFEMRWQHQYVEYSMKVKELLRKLLQKLENNYQYQRFLEDELKLVGQENSQEIASENDSNSDSLHFSAMISNVSNLFTTTSSTSLRKSPSIVSQNSLSTPDEKVADDSKSKENDSDENDDEIMDIRNIGSTDFQDFEDIYKSTIVMVWF